MRLSGLELTRATEAQAVRHGLDAKQAALREVAGACVLRGDHAALAERKMALGHREHGDDLGAVDLEAELRGELADVTGYAALLRLPGLWSWRLRVVGLLTGLCWRMLDTREGEVRT